MGKYAEVQRYETREIQQYKHFYNGFEWLIGVFIDE